MPDSKKETSSGGLFVLAAAMLWGTTGTAQSFAPEGFDPLIIGACRLAIGGMALMLLTLGRREIDDIAHWPWPQVILSAAFTGIYQLSFFAAVARTGVAVGTIVGIGSSPVAAGILGFLFRGERPGRRWGMATASAILGCALLGLSRNASVRIDPWGLVLAVVAGSAYAAYSVSIKNLLEIKPPNAVMALVVCTAGLLLSPLFALRPIAWLAHPAGMVVVLHLGIFTMALSYWCFARGLMRIPVATAVTLSLAEPMTATLLAVLLVGERLPPAAWLGLGMILGGLGILALRRPR